jgi:diacylglycerol diphosphate phosphatase/phosphatidate phosphatase
MSGTIAHFRCYSLQSFPSRLSAESAAVAVFLSLYINAKLKTFADFSSNCWSVAFAILPLLMATVLSAALWVRHVSTA